MKPLITLPTQQNVGYRSTITPITIIRAAYARALALDDSNADSALHAVAQALALPIEAVREAVEREGNQ